MPEATPLANWIGFHLFILALLCVELIIARRRGSAHITSTAIFTAVLWITAAFAFAAFIYRELGGPYAIQYISGYAIEQALSVDNLFVFLLLFRLFRIDRTTQPRVLFWGVAGAIVMRGLFIAGGLGLLSRFDWITYFFAAILLVAAIRLLLPRQPEDETHYPSWLRWLTKLQPVSPRLDRFFVQENGRRMVTVLFVALIAIEVTDVVFALDSIPAVLSITRHPFLAYTSNIMAVMGLRSLYFLLVAALARLRWVHYGIAALLAFAALKMLLARVVDVTPLESLTVIATLLAITIAASLLAPSPPATALR